MKNAVLLLTLMVWTCLGFPAEENQSVVSVYTTQPTTAGTAASLDVYHQIANNIAEKITSPIIKFLGLNKTMAKAAKIEPPKSWSSFGWPKVVGLDDAEEDNNNMVEDEDERIYKLHKLQNDHRGRNPIYDHIYIKNSEADNGERLTLYSGTTPEDIPYIHKNINGDKTTAEDTSTNSIYSHHYVNEMKANDEKAFELEVNNFKPKPTSTSESFISFFEMVNNVFQLALGALKAIFVPGQSLADQLDERNRRMG